MPIPPLKKYDLPEIDPEDMTPQVTALVDFVKEMLLRHEEAGKTDDNSDKPLSEKRPGSQKKNKTATLKADRDLIIEPAEPVPQGSRFKGYRDFVVQDSRVTPFNTRYRLAHWQTPDGQHLVGKLPASLRGGHFGSCLVSYILYQHHHCLVTQPLLHEQ